MSRAVCAGSEGARATVVSVSLDIYESTLIIHIYEDSLILNAPFFPVPWSLLCSLLRKAPLWLLRRFQIGRQLLLEVMEIMGDHADVEARENGVPRLALDEERLAAEFAGLSDPVLVVASAAGSRSEYLMRPDLGRRLAANAEATLASHAGRYDVVFVIADHPG